MKVAPGCTFAVVISCLLAQTGFGVNGSISRVSNNKNNKKDESRKLAHHGGGHEPEQSQQQQQQQQQQEMQQQQQQHEMQQHEMQQEMQQRQHDGGGGGGYGYPEEPYHDPYHPYAGYPAEQYHDPYAPPKTYGPPKVYYANPYPAKPKTPPSPTPLPSPSPTLLPTNRPTPIPTHKPSPKPSFRPTPLPTPLPTNKPTPIPTRRPTRNPTQFPTPRPTEEPSANPTDPPSPGPSPAPSPAPSPVPTKVPSPNPSESPTNRPSETPSISQNPTNYEPTRTPSENPTRSEEPSDKPTRSEEPSNNPTKSEEPSDNPTQSEEPSDFPTQSEEPSTNPTFTFSSFTSSFASGVETDNVVIPIIEELTLIEIICAQVELRIFCEALIFVGLAEVLNEGIPFPGFLRRELEDEEGEGERELQIGTILSQQQKLNNDLSNYNYDNIAVINNRFQPLPLVNNIKQFTVFGPTNAAFDRLGTKKLNFLFSEEGRYIFNDLLNYHIIPGYGITYDNLECNADYQMRNSDQTTRTKCRSGNLKFQVGKGNTKKNNVPQIVFNGNFAFINGVFPGGRRELVDGEGDRELQLGVPISGNALSQQQQQRLNNDLFNNNYNNFNNIAINGVLHIVDEVILPQSCIYGSCKKKQQQCINQLKFKYVEKKCDKNKTQDNDKKMINYCKDVGAADLKAPVDYNVKACNNGSKNLNLIGGKTEIKIEKKDDPVTLELEKKQCLPDCVLVSITKSSKIEQEFNIDTRCDGDQLGSGNNYGAFKYVSYECPK